jgi:hypothetical protein
MLSKWRAEACLEFLVRDDPAWLNLVRTSAGILMRAPGTGSVLVRAWLSALSVKMRQQPVGESTFSVPQPV